MANCVGVRKTKQNSKLDNEKSKNEQNTVLSNTGRNNNRASINIDNASRGRSLKQLLLDSIGRTELEMNCSIKQLV